ncbi:hypothetical protein CLOSTASPAR_03110 [[Clostridium] asparagiforme DSM 15981]|uniref:Uncharacterized protein n=1 Tax=[Clostridium] asparagiforme DSM 15981 TaxID=518636 RepID=C0D1H2_9FIRM|nr:hypothetical protein CLOSTASPAR_03110 [[Clostridium] asparagiforme DSM 15981]
MQIITQTSFRFNKKKPVGGRIVKKAKKRLVICAICTFDIEKRLKKADGH